MRGHQPLLEMRRRGLKPHAFVFVSTGPVNPDLHLERWAEDQTTPQVLLDPHDSPELLDWRFMAGMIAFVTGSDHHRVSATTAAILEAGASRVIAAVKAEVIRDTSLEAEQC